MRFRTSDAKTKRFFDKAAVHAEIIYIQDTLSGKQLRVVKSSSGKNPQNAILFIHGAPGSGDAFYKYLKDTTLLKNAVLYTMDRPGYGYSDFGNSVTSIEEQSRLTSLIIETIPENKIVVAGHSYGGPIAANVSLLSKKIIGILLISPAIDPENEKIIGIAHVGRWKATRWMLPKAWRVSADEKFSHIKELKKLDKKWKKITVPIIMMHGKKDKIVPFENTKYASLQFSETDFKLITFKKENHFIPWTQQEAVTAQLLTLLSEN